MGDDVAARAGRSSAAWKDLEHGLRVYLGSMVDPGEQDHLILELPPDEQDAAGATAPYLQFAGFGDGTMLRAEVSGDAYLDPRRRLSSAGREYLRKHGWAGNDEAEKNWYRHCPVEEAANLAVQVVVILRDHLRLARPTDLTHRVWGPAADEVYLLGLDQDEAEESLDVAASDGRADLPRLVLAAPDRRDSVYDQVAHEPADRAELFELVRRLLVEKYDDAVSVDDDGDFVLSGLHDVVWVRVHEGVPAIEIMARVAHDVPSRHAAASEISLLNRDHLWIKWQLRGRAIWQVIVLPGMPFVPTHLDVMLSTFEETLVATEDDLAFRLHANVG